MKIFISQNIKVLFQMKLNMYFKFYLTLMVRNVLILITIFLIVNLVT